MENKIYDNNDWQDLLIQALLGDCNTQYQVAQTYYNGIEKIVSIDKQEYFNWLKKAYKNGSIDAIEEYAIAVRDGVYCKKNSDLAIKIFTEAIRKNRNLISTSSIGFIYRDKQEYGKAFSYYLEDSKSEGNYSEMIVANSYYYGIGTERDRLKAFELYTEICEKNINEDVIRDSNNMLGKIYLEGEIVEKSIAKARVHFERANIENNNSTAQEILFLIGRSKDLV